MPKFSLIQLRSFFVEHWMIVLAGFLTASLMVLPLVVFPLALPKNTYQGINIANHGIDELWYLSRARDVIDGHTLGNVMMHEGKSGQDPYFTFVERTLMAPVRWFGLLRFVSVPTIFALLNFFGVWFLVVLIYFFTLFFGRDKRLAILAAVFVVAGYKICADPTSVFSTNLFSRAFSPYIPLIATFVYLNLLLRALNRDHYGWSVVSGVVFGLIFYIYFYAWSFLVVFNGTLAFLYLLRKEYTTVKKIVGLTLLGLFLGSYNLSQLFLVLPKEAERQLAYFHWVEYSRAPYFSLGSFVITICLAAVALFKKADKNFTLFWAFIISGWIVMNQQVITGKQLEAGHYRQYFILPFLIIIGWYLVWKFVQSMRIRSALCWGFVVLSFLVTAAGQFRSTLTRLSTKQEWQSYRPILDYLSRENNTGVVLAPDDINVYLYTIYTPHDVFWARGFLLVNMPISHMTDALFVYSYLNKNIRYNFSDYYKNIMAIHDTKAFYREPDWFYAGIYQTLEGYWSGLDFYEYNRRLVSNDPSIVKKRPETIKQLEVEYRQRIPDDKALVRLLTAYDIRYIVWDSLVHPEWDLSVIKGLVPVVHSGNITLYSFEGSDR